MEHLTTDQDKKHFLYVITFGLWLSWQELNGRRIVFFINLILIAFFVSLAVNVDLMGKARKSSVQNKIDYMGPSLSLVPDGITSADLVRAQLKGRSFPHETYYYLNRDMSSLLRGSEARRPGARR